MMAFLSAQPEGARDQVMALLTGGAVQLSVLLELDFADGALRLCNRNIPFTDLRDGHVWGAGAGLLVGLPEVVGGDDQLAPFREFQLGLPEDCLQTEDWAAELVSMVGDVAAYRGRDITLSGQLFDPQNNQPVGHPFAFDVGLMDKMVVSFPRGGAVVRLTSESFLARKGAPVYGMLTYFDQKRRHPSDEGLQFVTEAGKLITWTNW